MFASTATVEDLARFARALLSYKLLSADATKLLITGKAETSPGPLGGRYAYGFEDARHADGNGWVGHGGGALGMNGDLRIYPKSGYVRVPLPLLLLVSMKEGGWSSGLGLRG